MIKFKTPKFKKTKARLDYLDRINFHRIIVEYGDRGVNALSNATPVDSGETRNSWSFAVTVRGDYYELSFLNSVMAGNIPLVILLQYGHGTGTGGYVSGRDFINPALEPVYSDLKRRLISEVTR